MPERPIRTSHLRYRRRLINDSIRELHRHIPGLKVSHKTRAAWKQDAGFHFGLEPVREGEAVYYLITVTHHGHSRTFSSREPQPGITL